MSRLILASLALAALVVTRAEELKQCGSVQYYPSQYTCFEEYTLCPIISSLPTLPCSGACYSPDMYECVNEKLRLLPVAASPFIMAAHGDGPASSGQLVTACGGYLILGPASACTWCCSSSSSGGCGEYQNKTVLFPNGEMVSRSQTICPVVMAMANDGRRQPGSLEGSSGLLTRPTGRSDTLPGARRTTWAT